MTLYFRNTKKKEGNSGEWNDVSILIFNISGKNSFFFLLEIISVEMHHNDRTSACAAKKLFFLLRKRCYQRPRSYDLDTSLNILEQQICDE